MDKVKETEKEKFERLRLHFTSLFLQHPNMLDCQLPYFIQTDWLKWGLSDEDVEQAIHILNDTAA